MDQIGVLIAEPELGRSETDLPTLRSIVGELPFEPATLYVALLLCRLGSRLNNPHRQWQLAKQFYASQPGLLADYERILRSHPDRVIFSPQALTLLLRLLIEHARDEPLRELQQDEIRLVQDSVLGAHSALESSLDEMGLPTRDAMMAYELQAATFFRRGQPLEEMARQHELLRLATDDDRLQHSVNRVPVADWLAEYGATAEQQWTLGFGLSAITHAFDDDAVTPHIALSHLEDLLTRIGLANLSSDVPVIASSRSEFNTQFGAFDGDGAAMSWEIRPFTTTPFLRLANGDLLLLSPAWLLSWLGEGFHYRALRQGQELGGKTSGKYLRFVGEITELYALDLANDAFTQADTVFGEQRYGPNDRERTSDVAIVLDKDLVLFEVHARRVSAAAATGGTTAEATLEVTRLLVEKADQLGPCVGALLSGDATLPGIEISQIERIWPVVVSVGHVMQTRNLWDYLHTKMDETKAEPFGDARVQPLQVMDISDYEKLLGLAQAGESLPGMLADKANGPYRERDFAVWLHSPGAPSDKPRLSVLKAHWDAMTSRLVHEGAAVPPTGDADTTTDARAPTESDL